MVTFLYVLPSRESVNVLTVGGVTVAVTKFAVTVTSALAVTVVFADVGNAIFPFPAVIVQFWNV
jgi:hypothetical protein